MLRMFKHNRQNTSVFNGRTSGSQVGMLKTHEIQEWTPTSCKKSYES